MSSRTIPKWFNQGVCWICRQPLPDEPGQRGMRKAHTECRKLLDEGLSVAAIRGVEETPRVLPHGTLSTYANHKCRCDACRAACRAYYRIYIPQWRAKNRAAGKCTQCAKPAVEGKTRCEQHRRKSVQQARRARLAAAKRFWANQESTGAPARKEQAA